MQGRPAAAGTGLWPVEGWNRAMEGSQLMGASGMLETSGWREVVPCVSKKSVEKLNIELWQGHNRPGGKAGQGRKVSTASSAPPAPTSS